jgi:hypothetical protein
MYTRLITLEAARRHRYGKSSFDPEGKPYDPTNARWKWLLPIGCSNAPGKMDTA